MRIAVVSQLASLLPDLAVKGCKMDFSASSVRNTNETPTVPGVKRKYWSRREEEALITAVKELIIDGWQSGNGWRPGFNNQVARKILAQIPHSDIKGDPHVVSKMAAWGKDYRALAKLFGRSGNNAIAIDPNDFTISIVDTEIWDAALKVNPELAKMKNKSYPYYDDWELFFGNSRGTGDFAVDFGAAKQRVNNPLPTAPVETTTPIGLEDITAETGDATSATPHSEGTRPWKSSGIKKRKVRGSVPDDQIVSDISSALTETKTAISELSCAIRSLKEVDPAVTMIFSALQDLPEFTMSARVRAAKKIVSSQTHVALFFSMDEEGRKEFVRSILAE